MIAIGAGLGAALVWGISALSLARASKLLGGLEASAWVLLLGLLAIAPVAAVVRPHDGADGSAWGWTALAGVGSAVGITILIVALRDGKVGVVTPITSTQGALAGLIAVLAGASMGALTAVLVVVLTGAVAVVSRGPAAAEGGRPGHERRAVGLAVVAAVVLAAALYGAGRAAGDVPPVWIAAASRLAGVAIVTAPLALRGRLPSPRPALPFVCFSGVAEVTGYVLASWAAGDDVAVAGVLIAQFATVAAVGGWLVLGERLTRAQTIAVGVIVVCVAILAAT